MLLLFVRYDEFGRLKKKFRGTEADRKAREEAALARLHGTSGSGVRSPCPTRLNLPPGVAFGPEACSGPDALLRVLGDTCRASASAAAVLLAGTGGDSTQHSPSVFEGSRCFWGAGLEAVLHSESLITATSPGDLVRLPWEFMISCQKVHCYREGKGGHNGTF